MGRTIFIIGGARSGKSSYAIAEGAEMEGPRAYIATAEPLDEEMKARIACHRRERGPGWETLESPREVADVLREKGGRYGVIVLDCLTVWLANVLHSGREPEEAVDDLLSAIGDHEAGALYLVSNEVGMGIVPGNALARRFRDLAGFMNRRIAQVSDEVVFVTAGIPVRIK